MKARMLFLDDSGKPDAGHLSDAVVIGGFGINAEDYPTLSRRILGAKAGFYSSRNPPQAWEIKSSQVVKSGPWKRSKNRNFCSEIVRILGSLHSTVYSAAIDKKRMNHAMTLQQTAPLQLQALVEHFDAECRTMNRVGIVVADWSTHNLDQHASQCVASFVASKDLAVHPGVYYASSHSNEAIQVSDLIAGIRRRVLEGETHLMPLWAQLTAVVCRTSVTNTVMGRSYSNCIDLFR